ncbi:MAG: hypothetical protein HC905_06270 [Bacteroidales bacterium]|nr:hypothetical protein [Bacteroidales bacterium]
MGECNGACCGKELPETYNIRVKKALTHFEYETKSFFIIDKGRSNEEMSIVQIRNGKYVGYGFTSREFSYSTTENLSDCIKLAKDNRDIQQIIKHHIKNIR